MKHTKGPWIMSGPFGKFPDFGDYHVDSQDGINIAVFNWRKPKRQAEQEANARLISAAPELLEACKRALAIEESVTQGQEVELRQGFLDMLRVAIAKAESK